MVSERVRVLQLEKVQKAMIGEEDRNLNSH